MKSIMNEMIFKLTSTNVLCTTMFMATMTHKEIHNVLMANVLPKRPEGTCWTTLKCSMQRLESRIKIRQTNKTYIYMHMDFQYFVGYSYKCLAYTAFQITAMIITNRQHIYIEMCICKRTRVHRENQTYHLA